MVSLVNNVYRADDPSSLGGHTLGPPAGKLKGCWDNAVASWKANHPSALADIGPPIVSIVTPLEGASLEAIVTLTATAVDDRDVAGVQFRIDGGDIGSEVTAESPLTKFTMSWDSRAAATG